MWLRTCGAPLCLVELDMIPWGRCHCKAECAWRQVCLLQTEPLHHLFVTPMGLVLSVGAIVSMGLLFQLTKDAQLAESHS